MGRLDIKPHVWCTTAVGMTNLCGTPRSWWLGCLPAHMHPYRLLVFTRQPTCGSWWGGCWLVGWSWWWRLWLCWGCRLGSSCRWRGHNWGDGGWWDRRLWHRLDRLQGMQYRIQCGCSAHSISAQGKCVALPKDSRAAQYREVETFQASSAPFGRRSS